MEQFQSLINRLSQQAMANAPVAELMATTELLYCELSQLAGTSQVNVNQSVAVWLPAGYSSVKAPAPKAVEPVIDSERQYSHEQAIAVAQETPARSHSVPVPPQVVATPVAVPELVMVEQAEEEKPAPEVKKTEAEKPLFFQLHLTDDIQEPELKAKAAPAPSPRIPEPEPKPEPKPEPSRKPFPQYPDAETLMKNIFPLSPSPVPAPSKEINQLVVDPALPLNEKLQEKKVELGEVLAAGPKINDLRKAITINDKYQMISMLFRNDEDMFERSLRTLNNFGSLPEARFWMQRELVVKLGWNEEDAMVQHFYKLVSRRFA